MDVEAIARSAREAQRELGAASSAARTEALRGLARLLREREEAILAANRADVEKASANGLAAPLLARLGLTEAKLATLREGLEQLAAQPDPIGRPLRRTRLDDGLMLTQVQAPLGVLLIIFESRPDAVIQIGGLALRTGNAVLLKGGAEATASNRALIGCLRDALASADLPPDAVAGIEGREAVKDLLALDHLIDVVIPRGSGALVRTIQKGTRIPVLGHAEGICHLYLDRAADPTMAARVAVDGKCDAPSACNATETLLVHEGFLPHLATVGEALRARGVTLRADDEAREALPYAEPASPEDGATEYGDLALAVRVVPTLEAAMQAIQQNGSAHTDAIVTDDEEAAERFLRAVDSASVIWNASTRFADGYRYGLGAEVGISTGRIHARGPVGAEGLLTCRWILRGQGHTAASYNPTGLSFKHDRLPIESDER